MKCPTCEKPAKKKYCSQSCYYQSKVGKTNWWGYKIGDALRGKRKSPEHITAVTKALEGKRKPRTGSAHPLWKGDAVKYEALHDWVARHKSSPTHCAHCKAPAATNKRGYRTIHWANISKHYKRDLTDWIGLCRKCHYQFDKLPN